MDFNKINVYIPRCQWKSGKTAKYLVDMRNETVSHFVERLKSLLKHVSGLKAEEFDNYVVRDSLENAVSLSDRTSKAFPDASCIFEEQLLVIDDFGSIDEVIPIVCGNNVFDHWHDYSHDREKVKDVPKASKPASWVENEWRNNYPSLAQRNPNWILEGETPNSYQSRSKNTTLEFNAGPVVANKKSINKDAQSEIDKFSFIISRPLDNTEVDEKMYKRHIDPYGFFNAKGALVALYQKKLGKDAVNYNVDNVERSGRAMFLAKTCVTDLFGSECYATGLAATKTDAENIAAGVALFKLGKCKQNKMKRDNLNYTIEVFKDKYYRLFQYWPEVIVQEVEEGYFLAECSFLNEIVTALGTFPDDAKESLAKKMIALMKEMC